jgi:hypothetical protein
MKLGVTALAAALGLVACAVAVVVSGDADITGGHSIAHLRELQLR